VLDTPRNSMLRRSHHDAPLCRIFYIYWNEWCAAVRIEEVAVGDVSPGQMRRTNVAGFAPRAFMFSLPCSTAPAQAFRYSNPLTRHWHFWFTHQPLGGFSLAAALASSRTFCTPLQVRSRRPQHIYEELFAPTDSPQSKYVATGMGEDGVRAES
jgi:hypothetical protein